MFSISALTPSLKPLGPISTFAPVGMLDLGWISALTPSVKRPWVCEIIQNHINKGRVFFFFWEPQWQILPYKPLASLSQSHWQRAKKFHQHSVWTTVVRDPVFSVKSRCSGSGFCDLDSSSHLFVGIRTRTRHWNYSFVRSDLWTESMKTTFIKRGVGSLHKHVDLKKQNWQIGSTSKLKVSAKESDT
jgi:hypothetical protein